MHDLEQGPHAGPRRLAAVPAERDTALTAGPGPSEAAPTPAAVHGDDGHLPAAPVVPGDRLLATAGVLAEGAAALHHRLEDLEPGQRDAVLDLVSSQIHELVRSWTALVKSIGSPAHLAPAGAPEESASPVTPEPRPVRTNHPAATGLEAGRRVPLRGTEPARATAGAHSASPLAEEEPSVVGSRSAVERRHPPRKGRDELTGVLNRSAGLAALEREIDRCRRGGERFVLGYLNVDGMTAINDERGLRAGDEVLRKVTAALRATLRSYDVIARLGGDEFLFSVPGADVTTAELRFKEFSVILAEDAPGTSASVGFADLHLHDTLDELVEEAETTMLKGRRQRRRGRG